MSAKKNLWVLTVLCWAILLGSSWVSEFYQDISWFTRSGSLLILVSLTITGKAIFNDWYLEIGIRARHDLGVVTSVTHDESPSATDQVASQDFAKEQDKKYREAQFKRWLTPESQLSQWGLLWIFVGIFVWAWGDLVAKYCLLFCASIW